jgi:hypothetical protein
VRRAVLGGFVLVLALAGCAAPVAPEEPPVSSPLPTVAPEPVVLEVPSARIPETCADLLPPETLAALGPGWELARDGVESAPRTALQTARRQTGTTDCAWAGPDGATLALLVIPDASLDEFGFSVRYMFTDGALLDPFGTDSLILCDDAGCDFSALVAEQYWFAGRAEKVDAPTLTPVLADLRARADAAAGTPNPTWTNPPAVHPGWGRTCGAEGLVAGMARLAFDPRLEEADIRFPDHDQVVVERVDPGYCRLIDPDDPAREILLALVPGGAWAVQELAAAPGALDVVEVEGLGTVLVSGDPARYTALTTLQGSLVQVGMPAADRGAFLDVLPDVVELIRRTPYTAPVEED